jgi:hypothetical protein
MVKPESDGSYVTIPYFLYEAMARAYYARTSGDMLPVRPVTHDTPQPQFTGDFTLDDEDIPSTWKPQGLAAELRKKKPSAPGTTLTPEEK